jgi:hypothetical protein
VEATILSAAVLFLLFVKGDDINDGGDSDVVAVEAGSLPVEDIINCYE